MSATRVAEEVNSNRVQVTGVITIVVSLTTWFMFVGWLLSAEQGGLGKRNPDYVVPEYFNWHPLLMSATFLLFMTPAVLSFEIYPFSRKCNKIIHGTSNSFALMSIIAGLYIILDCHLNLSESGIFNSIHAVCGYMTFGLLCLVWLVGITLYGFGCCSDELKRAAMPYHKRLGIFTLFCGYATMLLGLSETVKEQQLSLGQLIAGCVFLTMLGVIFTIIRFVNKRDEIHEYVATENDEPDEEDDDDQMVVET